MTIGRFFYKAMVKFNSIIVKGKSRFFYKYAFREFGRRSIIKNPLILNNPHSIMIGDEVTILNHAWLSGPLEYRDGESLLKIGDHCAVGNYSHIYSTAKIIIEDHVLIADKVYISDNLHDYRNTEIAVMDQNLLQLSPVTIGQGSWIGENVCIIGASVGKHCVIGANAVVTKSIPDFSIAAGVPAKVIRQYNHTTGEWLCI
jgi:acetyltransferase-like isoleucine patch superfamily enzyme